MRGPLSTTKGLSRRGAPIAWAGHHPNTSPAGGHLRPLPLWGRLREGRGGAPPSTYCMNEAALMKRLWPLTPLDASEAR